MSASKAAVEFRRGQLIAGIESARQALSIASRSYDLLTPDDNERFKQADDILAGIEQRMWAARQK